MISITTVLQIHLQMQKHRRTPLFRYKWFINFWLQFFDTRREIQFLKVFCNHTMLTIPNIQHISWCFRSQLIFAGRDPKNLTAAAMSENSTVCLHGPMSTFNSMVGFQLLNTMVGPQLACFLKSSNSEPTSSGHDVIHTPASFSVWGLLWQWWLSYPLHASVKLYPMTMHLNS